MASKPESMMEIHTLSESDVKKLLSEYQSITKQNAALMYGPEIGDVIVLYGIPAIQGFVNSKKAYYRFYVRGIGPAGKRPAYLLLEFEFSTGHNVKLAFNFIETEDILFAMATANTILLVEKRLDSIKSSTDIDIEEQKRLADLISSGGSAEIDWRKHIEQVRKIMVPLVLEHLAWQQFRQKGHQGPVH